MCQTKRSFLKDGHVMQPLKVRRMEGSDWSAGRLSWTRFLRECIVEDAGNWPIGSGIVKISSSQTEECDRNFQPCNCTLTKMEVSFSLYRGKFSSISISVRILQYSIIEVLKRVD